MSAEAHAPGALLRSSACSNTLLTLAAFAALTRPGCRRPPASALAFAAGAVNGYVLNRRWTFAAPRADRHRGALRRGAGARRRAQRRRRRAVPPTSLARLAAEAIVLPCVTLTTYTLSRVLVFGGP